MILKSIKLENFTVFENIICDFSPGINIFIGENGTGKTHLLKILYAFCSCKSGVNDAVSEPSAICFLKKRLNYFQLTENPSPLLIAQSVLTKSFDLLYADDVIIKKTVLEEDSTWLYLRQSLKVTLANI